jgi:hypothetical protein
MLLHVEHLLCAPPCSYSASGAAAGSIDWMAPLCEQAVNKEGGRCVNKDGLQCTLNSEDLHVDL